MVCDQCKQNPASVQFTQMVNGELKQLHLCPQCAAQMGMKLFGLGKGISIPNMLGNFFGLKAAGNANEAENTVEDNEQQCPRCGSTAAQIRRTGRMGCGECYRVFAEELQPLISQIHGATQHTGKLPSRCGSSLVVKKKIESLKLRLQEAVAAEKYEEAAEIRDSIKELQAQMEGVS